MSLGAVLGAGRRRLLAMVAVLVVIVVVVAVVLLSTRGVGSSDRTVPPLTAAEHRAGTIRVTYPDRGLPDEPEITIVDGTRVALFFVSATGFGDEGSAVLRIGSSAVSSGPLRVELGAGQPEDIAGVVIRLVAAYHTGDLSRDAADVVVTAR